MVTGQVPMGYDLDDGWVWRLPGPNPWSEEYVQALAGLLDGLSPEELAARRAAVPADHPAFDRERQVRRVTAFVNDLLGEPGGPERTGNSPPPLLDEREVGGVGPSDATPLALHPPPPPALPRTTTWD
jgi:hypothetical protein